SFPGDGAVGGPTAKLLPAVRDAGERQAHQEIAVVGAARERLHEADVGGDAVRVETDAVADQHAVDVFAVAGDTDAAGRGGDLAQQLDVLADAVNDRAAVDHRVGRLAGGAAH